MGTKIWVDDVRPMPKGYVWCKSVKEAIDMIVTCVNTYKSGNVDFCIEQISLDYDAGNYACEGGDYVKLLDFLEEHQEELKLSEMNTAFRIHSMNPIGRQNMRRIIEKNNWKLIR